MTVVFLLKDIADRDMMTKSLHGLFLESQLKPPCPDVSMTERWVTGLPDLAASVENSWQVTGLQGDLGLQVLHRIKMNPGWRLVGWWW